MSFLRKKRKFKKNSIKLKNLKKSSFKSGKKVNMMKLTGRIWKLVRLN
jgi:hypothetical protein